MFLVLTALLLAALGHCYSSEVLPCPTECTCNSVEDTTNSSELSVDCHRRPDVAVDQLTEQLDSLLSSNLTCGRLTSLSIVNTPLTHVPRSVCRLTTLTHLYLDSNRLSGLTKDCLDNLADLRTLSASNNNITELPDEIFDRLTKLEALDVSWNKISFIALGVFPTPDKLPRLRTISLARNRLTSLEPWPYLRGLIGTRDSPVQISFVGNLISNFTNKMNLKFSCPGKVSHLYVDLKSNRIRHFWDIATGWNITVSILCFLRMEKGHPNIKINFVARSFVCDCIDFDIIRLVRFFPRSYRDVSSAHCNTSVAPWMGPGEIFRIPLDQFICHIMERCPPGCRCVHRPANATLHVYCSNSNLTTLPLELPALPKSYTKYKLDFSNNRLLRRMEHRDYFANTSVLDVTNCSIEEIPLAVWKDMSLMGKVSLDQNLLRSFSSSVANIPLNALISMSKNPWECSCENSWMSQWLRSMNHNLMYVDGFLCTSPGRLRGRNIIGITGEESCVDPLSVARSRAVAVTLSTVVGAIVILSSTGVIVYRLRIRMYAKWKFHPFDRDECLGEDMDYDVFLCCSSDDHEPNASAILQRLKGYGFRVCYHYTDFTAGATILENVEASITRSRRTVCLISEHFVQSAMCLFEFETALHHWISNKRTKRLIVLMALDTPNDLYANDASDTASLRQYLRQYTYIDYTADGWLDKLLYALPLRGMDHQQPENDDEPLLEM